MKPLSLHDMLPTSVSKQSMRRIIMLILIMFMCAVDVSPHTLRHSHFQNRAAALRQEALAAVPPSSYNPENVFLTTSPRWLNQTLDHFSPQESVRFPQRFFEFLDYFDAPNGPIFLIIWGESTCYGILNDYIAVLAKRFGAALVSLEHRYYGFSSPFQDLKIENLKYLNSKQALSDLAAFRNHYQALINTRYKRSSNVDNLWFTFGGSYAGALSAWFRLKFPHLAHGSLASSAPIHALEDYYEYDEQVAKSVGPECANALRELKDLVGYHMKTDAKYMKSFFGAKSIEDDNDFLSLLADSTAAAVQYGFQDVLCKPLVRSYSKKKDILATYRDFVNHTIFFEFGIQPMDYNREKMRNSTQMDSNSGSRQWTYQYCTEFGFFQTAPNRNSIRFTELNMKYYLDLCSYIFGKGTIPKTSETNLYYGGDNIAGTKIIFTNGSQDPWRHASKTNSTNNELAILIECQNCAHCVDLNGCPQFPFNPQGDGELCHPRYSIQKARETIETIMESWIINH
ncbi:hypothetical protein KP509_14G037800 [Ceratopteris richardii]|uniref:Serine protease EDA2 n=1 Tax=Ceratopteris richardii TaxID=49495 RepID=A0A8T2TBU2_CERRI|nr:hypothetical protein KP509_14G037800 [Ceratopteris richardii]